MKRALLTAALVLTIVAGCSSSGGRDPLVIVFVGGLNLVVDSPVLRYLLNDQSVATLNYSAGRNVIPLSAGDYTLRFEATVPSDLNGQLPTSIDVGPQITSPYTQDTQNIIIAFGTINQMQVVIVERTDMFDTAPEDIVRMQFVHAAGNIADLNLEIDSSNSGGSETLMPGTLSAGGILAPLDIMVPPADDDGDGVTDDPGSIQLIVRLTEPGNMTPTYTSAPIFVTEGANLIMSIGESVSSGPSTLKLVAISTDGSTAEFEAQGTTTGFRMVHTSPDGGALDMYESSDLMTPLLEDVLFRDVTAYVGMTPGDINLTVTPANDPATILFEEMVTNTLPALNASLYAVGLLADIDGLSVADNGRPVSTATRFRFFHVAPSRDGLPSTDIYLTDAGDPVDFAEDSPVVGNLPYRAVSNYRSQLEASYDATFVEANSQNILLGPVTINPLAGESYTYALIDDAAGMLDFLTVVDTNP